MPRRSKSFFRVDPRAIVDFFTVNWALKLTALVLAFLLWSVVKAEEPERIVIDNVPVRVDNRDPNWVIAGPPTPSAVTITVTGPSRELLRLALDRPTMLVPTDEVEDTTEIVVLRTNWVRMGARTDNTLVNEVQPAAVAIRFDRIVTRLIPVAVGTTGLPVPGFEQAGSPRLEPPAVRVSGPARRVAALDSLRLAPIDISGLSGTDTMTAVIDTTGLGVIVAPRQVQVIVPVRPIGADSIARLGPGTGRSGN